MKSVLSIIILSLLASVSWANNSSVQARVERKLQLDYYPVTKVCSELDQERLGDMIDTEDDRCMNMGTAPQRLDHCLHTTSAPIGDYKINLERGTCKVRIYGTSIQAYGTLVSCEDLQGQSLCDGQYDWSRPKKSVIPPFISNLFK